MSALLPSFLEFVKVEYKNTCIRNQKLSNMCHPVKYILAVINCVFQGSEGVLPFKHMAHGRCYNDKTQQSPIKSITNVKKLNLRQKQRLKFL